MVTQSEVKVLVTEPCGKPNSSFRDVYWTCSEKKSSKLPHLVDQLVEILRSVHSRGVVHRDIKPDNLVMLDKGEPLLIDFGMAHGADEEVRYQGGSLPYIPPAWSRNTRIGDYASLALTIHALEIGVRKYEKQFEAAWEDKDLTMRIRRNGHSVHTLPKSGLARQMIAKVEPMLLGPEPHIPGLRVWIEADAGTAKRERTAEDDEYVSEPLTPVLSKLYAESRMNE